MFEGHFGTYRTV